MPLNKQCYHNYFIIIHAEGEFSSLLSTDYAIETTTLL